MNLPADTEFGLLEAIVDLHDRLGLDEKGGARTGCVVHDSLDPAPGIRLDGKHVTIVPHCVVAVRQVATDFWAAHVSVQALLEFPGELDNFSAGGRQFG